MSLSPDARVLLTGALQPPTGFELDVAVGTTYSLDLTALLLAPMSFALFDHAEQVSLDPVKLLGAVQRHAEHTTVFCQAGAIHVPAAYRSILTFVEDSVQEVQAPRERGLFHPKIWALRFVRDGQQLHRVIVLSRNLTFDQSWDTALVLDETAEGTIDAAPAAQFVRRLPGLTVADLKTERAAQITSLAGSLERVRLAAPEHFTGGRLMSLGVDSEPVWPFPPAADRLVAISPFLARGRLDALAGLSANRALVSRPEALENLGANAIDGWDTYVLQSFVEPDDAPGSDDNEKPEESAEDPEDAGTDSRIDPRDGLHAKTVILDLPGGRSEVVTGSANLTEAAWHRNVEFIAVLEGPTAHCGVSASLDGAPGVVGLMNIIEPFIPETDDGTSDVAQANAWEIERFHHFLAAAEPELRITKVAEDRVRVTLQLAPGVLTGADPALVAGTRLWPVALTPDLAGLPLAVVGEYAGDLSWVHAPENISPFVAVETTLGVGEAKAVRRFALKAALTGDVPDRRQEAVLSILKNKTDVLRYLVFLLGDPTYEALAEMVSNDGGIWGVGNVHGRNVSVALMEPLVRATGQDTATFGQIARLMDDLRDLSGEHDLMPEGLEALWETVWNVHQELRR